MREARERLHLYVAVAVWPACESTVGVVVVRLVGDADGLRAVGANRISKQHSSLQHPW